MQGSEITQEGFYWYPSGSAKTVVRVREYDDGLYVLYCGDEIETPIKYFPFDFTGPLEPPA